MKSQGVFEHQNVVKSSKAKQLRMCESASNFVSIFIFSNFSQQLFLFSLYSDRIYLNRMLQRNNFPRSRNSSKSYKSTSPSYHFSTKGSQPRIPSSASIPEPASHFLSSNERTLNQLIKILKEQGSFIEKHRQWCLKVTERIGLNFEFAKQKVNSILQQQESAFRNNIEKEYINFMQMLSQIKDGIRTLYQQKIGLEKYISVEKNVATKQKKLDKIQDYYGSPFRQNNKLVNEMQRQNEQRQDFRSLNMFYTQNKSLLERLDHQAVALLAFSGRLQQREEEVGLGLEGFLRAVQLCFGRSDD